MDGPGIALVSVSVIADAFLPNFQERVFDHGSSRIEVTFFTNILCLAGMTGNKYVCLYVLCI